MWILTIMLLFASGEAHAFTFSAPSKPECQVVASDDALRLREVGLHVVSSTCERVKGV